MKSVRNPPGKSPVRVERLVLYTRNRPTPRGDHDLDCSNRRPRKRKRYYYILIAIIKRIFRDGTRLFGVARIWRFYRRAGGRKRPVPRSRTSRDLNTSYSCTMYFLFYLAIVNNQSVHCNTIRVCAKKSMLTR